LGIEAGRKKEMPIYYNHSTASGALVLYRLWLFMFEPFRFIAAESFARFVLNHADLPALL